MGWPYGRTRSCLTLKIQILIMLALIIPIAYAMEECLPEVEPQDIPCLITSTWNYTAPCNGSMAVIYNASGNNILNLTYGNFGTSGRCNVTWNITTTGSYTGSVTNGDTFNISVGRDNMQLTLIIGIGISIAAMLFLAFKLDSSHILLQIGLIFFSIIQLSLIPAVIIIDTANIIFHKIITGFIVVFWLYVGCYLLWFALKKAGIIVTGDRNE